ncbi:hypothetical protein J6590_031112 [Homalodisca vitripennis]|nr:hypothetical protein J6590_031112 [Homalodisca vitripennis]
MKKAHGGCQSNPKSEDGPSDTSLELNAANLFDPQIDAHGRGSSDDITVVLLPEVSRCDSLKTDVNQWTLSPPAHLNRISVVAVSLGKSIPPG